MKFITDNLVIILLLTIIFIYFYFHRDVVPVFSNYKKITYKLDDIKKDFDDDNIVYHISQFNCWQRKKMLNQMVIDGLIDNNQSFSFLKNNYPYCV